MKSTQFLIGLLFVAGASTAVAAESPWYFRADIGYALGTDADIKDNTPGPGSSFDNLCDGSGAPGSCAYELDDVGNSSAWGLGVGYRLDDNIRMDVTGTYRPGFEVDDSIASFFGGNDTHKADVDVTTLMFSGYYDIDMQGSELKPYVGAGLGWSWNEIGSTTVTNPTGGLTRTHGGDTESDFAWQLIFGVAIPMNGGNIIDVAYKYVDAGEIDSGASQVTGNAGGPFGPIPFNGVSGDMAFHEISVGIRF